MKILFIFWYEEICCAVNNTTVTAQELFMNADRIFIGPDPYILLHVSKSLLGRTA